MNDILEIILFFYLRLVKLNNFNQTFLINVKIIIFSYI